MLREVIEFIARTNLFNFVIFLVILICLFNKIDVISILENAKNSIAETIKKSESTKSESENHLQEVEEQVAHLDEEVDGIIQKSNENAKLVGEKILEDASKTVASIKDNSEKLVENKTVLLKNDILRRASIASVEVAKNHIIGELNNNYDLHQKLIDESVEALNGLE